MTKKNIANIPSDVLQAFWRSDNLTSQQLDTGHVHQTCLIRSKGESYILQSINTKIFQNPRATVENIEKVNEHLSSDVNYLLRVPRLRRDRSNDLVYQSLDGDYWRCMEYVSGSKTIEMAHDPMQAHSVALSFGAFSASLANLAVQELHITIPKFHDPESRWLQFKDAIEHSKRHFSNEINTMISRIRDYEDIFLKIRSISLPTKIAHNDPKITNVLFDEHDRPISIIDLDTVMPGTSLHDFGDMVRSMASTVTEDHPLTEEVSFSKPMYEALETGFIEGAGDSLEEVEKEHLLLGAKYIILEQAARFFTDYLNGNIYYKVKDDQHNMVRSQNQLALLDSMSKAMD